MFQKNRFLFVLLFAVQSLFAQIPQGFNYQATVRNQTGELLTNEYVGIRFHIVQGTEQNNPVYSEFHYESTDDLGSLHLMIGQGTVEVGVFSQIDWSLGDYHTGIEINTGDGFIDMGTTQLMSVPFALYALNSGTNNNVSLPQGNTVGDLLSWNGSAWTVEDVSATLSPVYLAENGITVKARDWAGIGAKGMLNGVEYTVVDRGMIQDMYDYDSDHRVEDMTTFCTTRLTNLENDAEFYFGDDFNQDISTWDVSNVTDMSGMFYNAQNFNQDLSAWNVRNVTNMSSMFQNASSFNQDLSAWDVRNVTTMSSMFQNASSFNQDLSAWDVRNVTTMSSMFQNASSFNQDLSAWDVSNVRVITDFDAETPSWTLPKPNFITPFYLDANGVTVKVKEGTSIGAKGLLNNVEYTLVDDETLRGLIGNGEDVTTVCTSRITNMDAMFYNAQNFNQDLSAWDVSNVTTMSSMFNDAHEFNQDLSAWDVSNVTTMSSMFNNAHEFNQDLSAWDVSNVTDMSSMFDSAPNFNQDISTWDVSNVTDMYRMFYFAQNFNQDLSAWDVSNVTTMSSMFLYAYSFNQDLSTWDVGNVTTMSRMFYYAHEFNQDLSAWDVSNVTDMSSMFDSARNFNQDISTWDVSNVTDMYRMFYFAQNFNQDLSAWDVSNVTTMGYMFLYASSFNQDLSTWDVGNVTTMSRMFYYAQNFNQDLSTWDVRNVTDMSSMFISARNFNQDLSTWDVGNVTTMSRMFYYAQNFNQDLSTWDVRNVTDMSSMFDSARNFNQDISTWDVSNVTTMSSMFLYASSFNQDLSDWDISNVQEYLDFDSDTPQWTLPKPNFKITNVSFTSTASLDGTKITITPTSTSIGGTLYTIDFNDPAAAEGADIKETFGGGVTYDYPIEDATYTITVTASSEGYESVSYSADLTVTYREVPTIVGTWKIAPIAGALGVGPNQGNLSWWSNSEEDVATRACFFDDTFVFGADGSFANNMGDTTWLEGWQGADEGCGTPVYPHDGAATDYTYTFDADASTITVNGVGAHLGLARAYNGGELTSTSEAAGIESITYNIVEISEDGNRMTVDIQFQADGGYWTYVLQRGESDNGGGSDDVDTTITGVDFTIAELNGDGNEVGVTPTSTGGTLYYVDFGDPAAANDEDVIATSGPEVSYTYAKESATYTITVTASASNAAAVVATKDHSVTVENRVGPLAIAGTWKIAPIAGALGVGPERGDISWWSLEDVGVTDRACYLDDEFVFGADGSFSNVMGGSTWLEGWQGADEGCGAPVYPHNGAATDYTYTYDADASTITVNGVGAHLGMSKVHNGGELSSPSEAAGIESITYTVTEISEDGNRMTVDIQFQAGGGFWTYVLTKN